MYGQGKSPKIVAFDCGMKYNIVRYFVKHHGVQFTVVPYDYDLKVPSALRTFLSPCPVFALVAVRSVCLVTLSLSLSLFALVSE